MKGKLCQAWTANGYQCPTGAKADSIYCHVHDDTHYACEGQEALFDLP